MRAGIAAALGLVSALTSGSVFAQTGIVVGRVVVAGAESPLGYSVVKTASRGERFTDAAGRFTIRVPAGPVTLTAKHIGYAPLDTTISVHDGDTVRVVLALSLITIQLPAVQSLSPFCAHPGSADARLGLQLAALFEQMIQNAERNRLLTRSYPFEMDIERKITKPEMSLLARFVAFDTVIQASERKWRYAPGHMLGTREYGPGVFEGKWTTITVPELADFADPAFLDNHCFEYAGIDVVEGDSLLRIDFQPAPSVRTPDIAGSLFLDRTSYQLRWTVTAVTNLTKEMQKQTTFQEIRVGFKEIVPGVPVADVVASIVFPNDGGKGPSEPSTETHRTLKIRFLGARP
jgi:hypothetical protein